MKKPIGELQSKKSPVVRMIREVGFGDEGLMFSHITMIHLLVDRTFTKLLLNPW